MRLRLCKNSTENHNADTHIHKKQFVHSSSNNLQIENKQWYRFVWTNSFESTENSIFSKQFAIDIWGA